MKRAFLFPGQGAQALGMGVAVADAFPEARTLFDQAADIAGYDVAALCADGPIEKLSDTRYTQPCLFTVEAAITAALNASGVSCDATAGHSLGEFAAWHAAGAISFTDGLTLVIERGRLMAEADPDGRGTMAAIIGLDFDAVSGICESVEGTVVLANINQPLQMVISGEKDAVAAASEKLSEAGAKRVVPLNVSGAFHSPLMGEAKDAFAEQVTATTITDATIPVYANVTAEPVTAAADIRHLMVEQLVSPVNWTGSVTRMVADGITAACEAGPGAVLAGLIKRIDKTLAVTSASEPEKIREIANG